MKILTLLFAMLTLATTAHSEGLDYNFIDVGWFGSEIDGGPAGDVDGDAFAIDGSIALDERVHAFASLSFGSFDFGVDVNSQAIGIGYNTPFTESIDFVAAAKFIRLDFDTRFASIDDNGFGIDIGLRGHGSEQFEYSAFLNYVNINDDDIGVSFSGLYLPAPQWGIGGSISFADDATAYGIFGRFYFRK